MSCDGYSKTALMGNWYEERIAKSQPAKENKEQRFVREEEDDISYVTRNNHLLPLGRVGRAHPWDTSSIVLNDGFKHYKTSNKIDYNPTLINNYHKTKDSRPYVNVPEPVKNYPENHTVIQTNQFKNVTLLNANNLEKQSNEIKRDVKINISDFGSTLKTHGPDHQRSFSLTTYEKFFDRAEKTTPQKIIKTQGPKLGSFAGYNGRPETQKGIRMTSALTGEVFKTDKDPQQNTRIQRAWLPYAENSIEAAEKNIKKSENLNTSFGFHKADKMTNYRANNSQVLPHDISTSLAMGEGVYSLKGQSKEPGAYRKIRSDVTMSRNNPITKK